MLVLVLASASGWTYAPPGLCIRGLSCSVSDILVDSSRYIETTKSIPDSHRRCRFNLGRCRYNPIEGKSLNVKAYPSDVTEIRYTPEPKVGLEDVFSLGDGEKFVLLFDGPKNLLDTVDGYAV
jgi:hypothetical protein